MGAPVFVVDADVLAGAVVGALVRLDGPEGRHAAAVRRLGVGEPVDLVDGRGGRLSGTVVAVHDRVELDVAVGAVTVEAEPVPRVVVVQALAKGERSELAVEMLTEVGVDVIVPWAAARCVTVWRGDKATRGVQHWRTACREAAKQSRRARFPHVPDLASTEEVVARLAHAGGRGLILDADARACLASTDLRVGSPAWIPAAEVVLVVGPEGGLTTQEVERFVAVGAACVALGPTVLRTSTAGTAAAAVVLSRLGRWG